MKEKLKLFFQKNTDYLEKIRKKDEQETTPTPPKKRKKTVLDEVIEMSNPPKEVDKKRQEENETGTTITAPPFEIKEEEQEEKAEKKPKDSSKNLRPTHRSFDIMTEKDKINGQQMPTPEDLGEIESRELLMEFFKRYCRETLGITKISRKNFRELFNLFLHDSNLFEEKLYNQLCTYYLTFNKDLQEDTKTKENLEKTINKVNENTLFIKKIKVLFDFVKIIVTNNIINSHKKVKFLMLCEEFGFEKEESEELLYWLLELDNKNINTNSLDFEISKILNS